MTASSLNLSLLNSSFSKSIFIWNGGSPGLLTKNTARGGPKRRVVWIDSLEIYPGQQLVEVPAEGPVEVEQLRMLNRGQILGQEKRDYSTN